MYKRDDKKFKAKVVRKHDRMLLKSDARLMAALAKPENWHLRIVLKFTTVPRRTQ